MKILAVNHIYYLPVSGINRVVKRIGEELVKMGHEYTVLTLHLDNSIEEVHERGIRVIKLPYCKYNKLGYEGLNALRFLLGNVREYDVVNSHNYYSFWSVFAAWSCKRGGVPFVFTPHYQGRRGTKKGVYPLLYDMFSPLGRLAFRWARTIICDSQYEKTLITRTIDACSAQCVVAPCGVDAVEATGKPHRSRTPASILYVGNLFESKGVQYLLAAVHTLRTEYRKAVTLSIVGDGPYRAPLEWMIRQYGLTEAVRFYSNLSREELNQQYRIADIFALLSYSEAYGIVVAEALAMGVPCIVAKAAALEEFTSERGCFGVDYPPDIKQLAALIVEVLDSNVSVGPLSEKIRPWDQAVKDYERVYANVAAVKD
jgi:glycosyltransferase involved in cell wall biosynthesis